MKIGIKLASATLLVGRALNMENQAPETIPPAVPPTEPEATIDPTSESATAATDAAPMAIADSETPVAKEPPPSYVKLAMRNMVRKRGTSLQHFFLTTAGLVAAFVGLAYLTR
jgi:Protein of unknown function (DUF3285)